jgi:CelD/BcsL family acetyltransferase involved in cellulose biosynthesis
MSSDVATSVISGRGMDPGLMEEWRSLQRSNPDLSSPYFCPEFTACVAAARGDVEVAVLRENRKAVCVFPYQREEPHGGFPVGRPLSDYHGLICAPDFRADLKLLLKACSLRTWRYDHLPASQTAFRSYHSRRACSPVIDVSQGFDRYLKGVSSQTRECADALRKSRRLAGDHGPLAFDYHVPDRALLGMLMDWKADQYRRSGAEDRFAIPWFKQVVINVFQCQAAAFAGVLSVLRAGDVPVALHFGMRAGGVWHYWFPAYDPRFARYSPGIIMLLKMAEAAPSRGIGSIDLGKGAAVRYKEALKSRDVSLAVGCVETPSPDYYWRLLKRRLRAALGRQHSNPGRTPRQR